MPLSSRCTIPVREEDKGRERKRMGREREDKGREREGGKWSQNESVSEGGDNRGKDGTEDS